MTRWMSHEYTNPSNMAKTTLLTTSTSRDGSNLLTNPVRRSLIHKLHADANVGIRDEYAVKRNGIRRIEVIHDLQFSQDLFPHRRFCVDQHDLFVHPWFVSEGLERYDG